MIASSPEYICVYTANGKLDAEMVKAFLEASDIEAVLSYESAGTALGLTIGPLGEVDILVPAYQEIKARELLAEMEKGKFEGDTTGEVDEDPDDDE
jgi:broad specificity phosphatase PhoE